MHIQKLVSLFFIITFFIPQSILGNDEPSSWADKLWRNAQERQAYERMRRKYNRENTTDKDPGSYDAAKACSDGSPDVYIRKTRLDNRIQDLDASLENEPKEGDKYTSLDARERELARDRIIAVKEEIVPLATTSLWHDAKYFALGNLRWVSAIFNVARAASRESLRKKPSANARLEAKRKELLRSEGIRYLQEDSNAIAHIYNETIGNSINDDSLCMVKKNAPMLSFKDSSLLPQEGIKRDAILGKSAGGRLVSMVQGDSKIVSRFIKRDTISFSELLPSESASADVTWYPLIKSDVAQEVARLRPEYEAQDRASVNEWWAQDKALAGLSGLCVLAEEVHTLLGDGVSWKWQTAFALSNMAEYWMYGDRCMPGLPASFEAMGLRFVHHQANFDTLQDDTLFKYHAQNFLTSFVSCIARRLCSLCSYAPIDENLQAFCGYIIDSKQSSDLVRFAYDLFLPIFLLKYHFDVTMPQWHWYVLNNTIIYVVGTFFKYVSSLAYDGNPYMLMLTDRYMQQVAPSLVLGEATRELISFTREAQYAQSREAFKVYHRTVVQMFEDTAFETVSHVNSWCESIDLSQVSNRLSSLNFPSLPYLKESYYIYGMAGRRFLFKGKIDYNECIVNQVPQTLTEVLAIMSKNREEVDREERWRLQLAQLSQLGRY